MDKLPSKIKSKQFPDCRHFSWPDLLYFPSLGMAQILIYSTVISLCVLKLVMTYFYNIVLLERRNFPVSLVFMSKLLVSFRQFEKSLRVNASDLCCYETLGNMLGNGIYGFSDPGKYILERGLQCGRSKLSLRQSSGQFSFLNNWPAQSV